MLADRMRIITFASGSKGNCTLVSCAGHHFLIDCGISMRRIKSSLAAIGLKIEDISAIFITHEHSDHICGLSMLTKYYNIPICAPRTVAKHLRYSIAGVEDCLRVFPTEGKCDFGGVLVSAFHTSHDTEESVGYRFESECVFALATDTGVVTDEMLSGLLGADAVVLESNHDVDMLMSGSYPYTLKRRILSDHGHLSNEACGELAAYLADWGTKYIILGHLSRENNSPARAFHTVKNALNGREVLLLVAPESEPLTLELGGSEK